MARVAQPPAVAAPRPAPVMPAATPAARSGHPFLKIVVAVLGVIFILGLLTVGAGVYFYYYHVKPKVAEIENTVRSLPVPTGTPQSSDHPASPGGGTSSSGAGSSPDAKGSDTSAPPDLGQALQQLGLGGKGLPGQSAAAAKPDPHFPQSSPGDPSNYSGQLTFQRGMTITSSISDQFYGDYEVLDSITSVSEKGTAMRYSAELPDKSQAPTPSSLPAVRTVHELHNTSQQDLMHATGVMTFFGDKFPESMPGTTQGVLSQDAFHALKSGSGIDLTFPDESLAARLVMGLASMTNGIPMGASPGGLQGSLGQNDFWSKLQKYTCHAVRIEVADAAFPVLLNGLRVTLPAIHMSCPHDGVSGFEYVFDDDQMPLRLATSEGQITQINFPQPKPRKEEDGGGGGSGGTGAGGGGAGGGQSIEQALKKEGRVDVYGIYFDFASDKLRPESAPVLAEIASALKDNPTWKLQVNGHTDNIGGDAYNLDLSNRRAASVKQALVTQYHIDPALLDPKGFGATQPKEPNDTAQGRARNRRVELIRE
ncbi:MAG TPA: OmpA family protein [Terriglobia bacterium]|nr:OmpA family protein [Terriglobia bacterium]